MLLLTQQLMHHADEPLQAIAGHVESLRVWTYQQQLC
jgi:hypothetical protein